MTSATSELTQLRKRLSREDPTLFLGRLFWYTVSDVRVPHTALTRMLRKAGITHALPGAPKDVDVFKRVCTATKRSKLPTDDPNVFENWRMVEFKDDASVTRRVIRERVNNKGRTLDMIEVFDIMCDRTTSDLAFRGINGHRFRAGTIATELRDEVTDEYYAWRGCLNGYAIREWIRHYLLSLNATCVRPGVYFISRDQIKIIEALESLEGPLSRYLVTEAGKVEVHSLPLVDDRKQRERVKKAFEAETVDAIDDFLIDLADLTKSDRKITRDKYAQMMTEFQDLVARTEEYEALLESTLSTTGRRLNLFKRSLLNARKNVKE